MGKVYAQRQAARRSTAQSTNRPWTSRTERLSEYPYRDQIESAIGGGFSLSSVTSRVGNEDPLTRVRGDSQAATFGSSVAFRRRPSLRVAAHEATHVLQQRQRNAPSGDANAPDNHQELQATAVADRITSGRSAASLVAHLNRAAGSVGWSGSRVVQPYTQTRVTLPGYSRLVNAKVSDNKNAVVVPRTQKLWATQALMTAANAKLAKAGPAQRGSMIRLERKVTSAWGGQLTRGAEITRFGKKLIPIMPRWVKFPIYGSFMSKWYNERHLGVHELAGDKNRSAPRTRPMLIWDDCGYAASAVMGSTKAGHMEAVYYVKGVRTKAGQKTATLLRKSPKRQDDPAVATRAIYLKLIPEFVSRAANRKYLRTADDTGGQYKSHYVAGTSKQKSITTGQQALTAYFSLTSAGRMKFDKEAGINAYIAPGVGEAFSTVSEDKAPGWKKVPGKKDYPHHFGAVILADGGDRVTLENFRGPGKNPVLDRQWEFNMYSTTDASKSFHKHHTAQGFYGTKTTSIHVRDP